MTKGPAPLPPAETLQITQPLFPARASGQLPLQYLKCYFTLTPVLQALSSPWRCLMPPKSKAQARFMWGVAGGSIKKAGLSRAKAKEFVAGVPEKGLPARVTAKGKAKAPVKGSKKR